MLQIIQLQQTRPHEDARRRIDGQHLDGGPSHIGLSHEQCFSPGEVIMPAVSSGMKKAGKPARVWINSGNVWPLAQIASSAAQREIRNFRTATVLAGNDVIDQQCKF